MNPKDIDTIWLPTDLSKIIQEAVAEAMPKAEGVIFGGIRIQTSPHIPDGMAILMDRAGNIVVVNWEEETKTLGAT